MKEKKALGRGLASLIPQAEVSEDLADRVIYSDLDSITPNPKQPRKKFDKEALQELADSIKEKGVIQPILAKRVGRQYMLIAGHRRFEAAKIAKLERIPVIVRSSEKSEDLELALIENIQRENLNPVEEAGGYRALVEEFGLSHEDVARKVGKSRASVTNFLRLLKLPKEIQDALMEGRITMGHAKSILSVEGEKEQLVLFKQILQGNMSVRKTEDVANKVAKSGKSFKLDSKSHNPLMRSVIEELQRILGTRVKILQKTNGKGRIIIDFFSTQDLNRLLGMMRKS